MKLEIKAPTKIEDGLHEGVIIDVEYRSEPYEYTDLVIEFPTGKDSTSRLKAGYPTKLSKESSLGKLMERFGFPLIVGEELDPDVLVTRKCKFQTITESVKDKGEFSRILVESVKPVD